MTGDADAARSQAAEELDRLVAAIAHELKTPLAVIIGCAELLGDRGDERTRLEASARIQEAAERLSTIIDDVLATATLPEECE